MKNIFSLLRYILPYKKNAFLNILFNILSVVFSISSIVMVGPFLKILFGNSHGIVPKPDNFSIMDFQKYLSYIFSVIDQHFGKISTLMLVSAGMIFFSFLRNLFAYLSMHVLSPLRAGIVKDIRNNLYVKILSLPASYFSNEKKGDLMARMTNDVAEIEASIISSLEMVFRDPLTILFYLVALILTSPQLTIFALILLPISGFIIGRIGRRLRKQSFRSQTILGSLLTLIEETLTGLRIIKAFTAEKPMTRRFKTINDEYTKLLIKINRRRGLASPVGEFLGTVVMVIIMVFGALLILNHKTNMTPEQFLPYLIYFFLITEPAKRLSTAYYNILKGMASAERINFILKAENNIVEKENALDKKTFSESIEYKDVSFKYNRDFVLKNINLKIEKGKTIALVGQSGSGKSTLVDLLPRFYDIEIGEILVDGINIKEYKIKDLRRLMGIVNQEPILFNDTFSNNITFGRDEATDDEVVSAATVAHAHEFIIANKGKYNHNIGDRGGKLSGGQRQRVSIARAVLSNPPILILDEATSALDTESERLVQDALTNLMKNRTTIVIAHRLSTVIHADEICVLNEGQIVERGKHDELIQINGYYKRLHDLQMFAE